MSEVIKGLEGVMATRSAISSIIDDTLTYRGVPFDEAIGNASFEEVTYLLWHGDLPDEAQLRAFNAALAEERELPDYLLRQMNAFPVIAVPMDAVRTAVSALALGDPEVGNMSTEANLRKATRLVAQLPIAGTAFLRLRQGQQPIPPRRDLGTAGNILYTTTGQTPTPQFLSAMAQTLVCYADHELNASTFAARVCASTLSDMYGAVTAAIATLKGPLHGGANQAVAEMIAHIGDVSDVELYIKRKLAAQERIMGFGHRVYKHGDPRAKHLRRLAANLSSLTGDSRWYQIAAKIEEIVGQEKGLQPNVDFYSAIVFHLLGFPNDMMPVLFACGRVAGWTAHIMEQYSDNRLIRPRAQYVGPPLRHFVPLEQRGAARKEREAGGPA